MANRTLVCNKCKDKNVLIECGCGCGELRMLKDSERRTRYFINGHSANGQRNGQWKGGRIKQRDYWLIYKPEHRFAVRGYVRENRFNYEDSHNCSLLVWVDVHHKDDNPENNIWYNLFTVRHGSHSIISNTIDMSDRRCSNCRSDTTYYRRWFNVNNGLFCQRCYINYRRHLTQR